MKRKKWLSKFSAVLLSVALIGSSYLTAFPQQAKAATSEPYQWNKVFTGAGGGFIPGIIFNESEPDLIYTRTDIGGVYRWNPADSSWIQLMDWVGFEEWGKTGVDALATDPVDPDRVYIAAGTYTNSWESTNGYILRSTDRGDTWEETELPFKVGGNMPGRSMGERLAIDPNKNSILYFGARSGNGLWKSTDYGVTWNKVENFPNVGNYVQDPTNEYQSDIMGLAWITFDKSTGTLGQPTQTIYVGVADKDESIYRSTDGGATWSAVPGQPKGFLPHHGVLSSTGELYIPYNNGIGPYDGTKGDVWKYNTKTGKWTNISPVPSTDSSQTFGYGGLAVDAQNPNTIVVANLNQWWPDANMYRSLDGGATWKPIWEFNGYPDRNLRYTLDISAAPWLDFGNLPEPPVPSPRLGWMIGSLVIDPFNSDRMMYGTGATLYGTDNLTNWDKPNGVIDIEVKAKNIEEMAILDLVSPPSGAHLLSAIGDVTGFRHDDLTKTPEKMFVNPKTSTSLDFAQNDPEYVVRVGKINRSETPNAKAIGFSRDGGGNWYTASEPQGTSGGGRVAVSPDGESIVWSTEETGVFYSHSNGNSWTRSNGVPVGAVVKSDRVNSNKFYAIGKGKFYVSTDRGVTFTESAATGLPNPPYQNLDFKLMPTIEGDIWLAGGDTESGIYGIWHSTDSGATFTKLDNVEEANVIGIGKAAPGQTYDALYTSAKIDGVRGIFRSIDAGASWVRINDDDHQYASTNTAITGDPRIFGRVYIGTNGLGIAYGDSLTTPEPVENSTITPTVASFDKASATNDVSVALTLNGNTLSAIKKGNVALTEGTDYTVTGTTVKLSNSYLASLAVGNHNLTFVFSAGANAVLKVAITDSAAPANSSITPTTATFDKKVSNQADLSVALTLNGNTLTNIKNGAVTLVEGTDYTLTGNTVKVLSSYLATQPLGSTSLTFNFSGGTPAVLAINIVDTTTPIPVDSDITVQVYNENRTASTQSINPQLKLINSGDEPIDLSDVTLRYYFTSDSEQGHQFFSDWASIGNQHVTGAFVKLPTATATADHYLQIGFSNDAGVLQPGQSAFIQTRFSKLNWSSFNQANDYSFDALSTTYQDNTKVTGYVAGQLVWGNEPQ